LRELLNAEAQRCLAQAGIGPARYAILQAAVELARRHFREALRIGPALAAPRQRALSSWRSCVTGRTKFSAACTSTTGTG